ncbi:MAG: hypothetical protein HYZ49_21005 [Chloroflexi bacterium]|nr:hypothetical protein [Chloroflexota bacterium]
MTSLLVLLISSAPIIAGYISQTPDQVFIGAVYDFPDYNVHLASIQTGLRGSWQYPLLHSSEIIPQAYVKTFYIAVGQAGRILPLPPPALFEMARWLFGLWALFTMYAFAARFLWSVALRRIAFLVFALGSGLGWLMLIFGWQPDRDVVALDFWLIDLYGFFSLMVFPHFSAVFALMWTTALSFLVFWQKGDQRWLVVGLVTIVMVQAIQPFAPLIVDLGLAGYVVWGWLSKRRLVWREFWSLAALVAVHLPLLIYSATVFRHPVWQSFARQNQQFISSPPPIYYLLGVGLPGALAVWGAWHVIRRRSGEGRLLLAWIIAVMILIYLPTNFQRRFTEGVMGPLAVLAAIGLGNGLLPQLRRLNGLKQWLARVGYPYRRARGLLIILVVVFSAQSTLYLTFGGALPALARSPKIFVSADVTQAIDWLGQNSDWQDVVFSAERTGNLIPARIGHRVYLGHPIETAYYTLKVEQAAKFFGGPMTDDERRAVLAACACRYVFYGPVEKELGGFQPPVFLQPVFTNELTTIYEVQDGP